MDVGARNFELRNFCILLVLVFLFIYYFFCEFFLYPAVHHTLSGPTGTRIYIYISMDVFRIGSSEIFRIGSSDSATTRSRCLRWVGCSLCTKIVYMYGSSKKKKKKKVYIIFFTIELANPYYENRSFQSKGFGSSAAREKDIETVPVLGRLENQRVSFDWTCAQLVWFVFQAHKILPWVTCPSFRTLLGSYQPRAPLPRSLYYILLSSPMDVHEVWDFERRQGGAISSKLPG